MENSGRRRNGPTAPLPGPQCTPPRRPCQGGRSRFGGADKISPPRGGLFRAVCTQRSPKMKHFITLLARRRFCRGGTRSRPERGKLKYFSESHYSGNVVRNGMVTTQYIGGTESPMTGIIENIPSFKNDTLFVKHIVGQLCSDSLLSIIDFETPVSKERARSKKTTKYGDEFLSFIKDYRQN